MIEKETDLSTGYDTPAQISLLRLQGKQLRGKQYRKNFENVY